MKLRADIVEFMLEHEADFAPYMEDDEDFPHYCKRMKKVNTFYYLQLALMLSC